jgi:integrase/recombinase XerD
MAQEIQPGRSKEGRRCDCTAIRMASRRILQHYDAALLEHHFTPGKEFPVRPRRAQGLVKEVGDLAGLTKDITPHVLRHTFTATARQKGISLATVQKILGHDRLQTTTIYLNFTDTHIQEEFERKW